jgi:hypothetical protein
MQVQLKDEAQNLSDMDADEHPVEIQATFPTWAFLQDDGKFAPYEALACEAIEAAYQQVCTPCMLSHPPMPVVLRR